MQSNLFKKFLTYFYGSGIGLFIGLATTMISTRLLTPADFGKASMFTLAITVFMIFIVFGTDQAFVRFFYEEKEELRGRLLYNTLKLPLAMLILTLTVILLFQDQLMFFLFGETNFLILIALLIGIFVQFVYRFAVLVIRMQQKGHLFSLMEILNKSLNLGLLLLLFYFMGPTYEILIYSTVFALIILSIIAIAIEKRFWLPSRGNGEIVKHSQRDIFQFSYPLVLTTLITWLFQAFDKIALRQWSDFEELGLYSAAFRIVALLMVVQTTFTTFWTPVCYEHYEKHPEDRAFFAKTSRIISLIMFALAIVTILFKDLIVLLLGSEFSTAAIIMPFLIFMPMMYTMSETTVIGLNFSKKTKWHIVIAGAACLFNIIGNFILVPLYGASGAAVSTGLAYVLFFILRTHISLKYYYVDYGLKKVYTLLLLVSGFALQNMIWPNEILTYVTGVVLLLLLGVFYLKDLKSLWSIVKNKGKVVMK